MYKELSRNMYHNDELSVAKIASYRQKFEVGLYLQAKSIDRHDTFNLM